MNGIPDQHGPLTDSRTRGNFTKFPYTPVKKHLIVPPRAHAHDTSRTQHRSASAPARVSEPINRWAYSVYSSNFSRRLLKASRAAPLLPHLGYTRWRHRNGRKTSRHAARPTFATLASWHWQQRRRCCHVCVNSHVVETHSLKKYLAVFSQTRDKAIIHYCYISTNIY